MSQRHVSASLIIKKKPISLSNISSTAKQKETSLYVEIKLINLILLHSECKHETKRSQFNFAQGSIQQQK